MKTKNLPPIGPNDRWMTTAEVMIHIGGVCPRTIRRYRKQGLPSYGKGTIWFKQSEVDAWIIKQLNIQTANRQRAQRKVAKRKKL